MYKVHCLNNIAKVGTDRLGSSFTLTDEIDAAQAIMVRSASLHDVELSHELLAIARAGAGVNNIPLDRCAKQGIVVFNTPGANANGVKEMVIAGMLLASRDIVGGIEWVEENSDDPNVGKKAEKAKKDFAGTELAGKNLGVIGLGAIGAMVANAGRSLGMHVYGYDPYLSVKYAWSLDRHVRHVQNLSDIWANCDYITIHVPATDKTRGMIGRNEIAAMKDGVILINTSRGPLIREEDLREALLSGKVRAAAMDVLSTEPARMDNPLMGLDNCIITPHIAWANKESRQRLMDVAVENLRQFLAGNPVNNVAV